MTREKRILKEIKSIVEELYNVKARVPVDYKIDKLIEDAYNTLELNTIFHDSELNELKLAKFKLKKNQSEATRVYKKAQLTLFKYNTNLYTLKFRRGRKTSFTDLYDILEATGDDLENLYSDFING